ncbi:Gfo/Idh/MocA family protein [Enterococcus sp. LJL98]
MRFALVTAWHVHTEKYMEKARAKGAECYYVWDFERKRGELAAKKYGGKFEADYQKILSDPLVEAVVIEAPTMMHKELLLLAARHKKHIFCEKPLALSLEDCLEIEAAVYENQVKFVLSLESLSHPIYQNIEKRIKDGAIGEVTSAYFRRSHGAVTHQHLPAYWFDKAQAGGGATLDLGCHGFTLLPFFCGKPKQITCLMNEKFASGVDEQSSTVIEFESGVIATAQTSMIGTSLDNYLELVGTQGLIQVIGNEHEEPIVLLQSNVIPGYEKKRSVPLAEIKRPCPYPIERFIDLVTASSDMQIPNLDFAMAKQVTRIIECAYASAQTGKAISYKPSV